MKLYAVSGEKHPVVGDNIFIHKEKPAIGNDCIEVADSPEIGMSEQEFEKIFNIKAPNGLDIIEIDVECKKS